MAKKIRYYYDEETCSFLEEQATPGSIFKTLLSYLSVSGLIACILLAAFLFFYGDPKYSLLENQNNRLIAKITEYETNYSQLETQVDSLQQRDRVLYRSILNAEPISSGIWNGGTGGSANAERSSDPDELKNIEKRLDILKSKINLQSTSYNYLSDKFYNNEDELKHIPAIKPVSGRLISGFGMRMHPIAKIRKRHTGIDMQASTGTPVHATGDGIIKFAGVKANGYGKHIDIDHEYGYVTKYAHLSKYVVKKGQRVKRGDIIGYTGNTGLSKGPHLHYEIIKNGVKINPIDYFYSDLTPDEYVALKREALVENESMD